MPILHDLTPSFNAGELSPRLSARVDFAKYKAGVSELHNFKVLSEGGIMRRVGTRFVAEVKSSSVKGHLKRFEFSTTQAYVLEMGEKMMRFYRHQGQIVSEDITASITNGDFPSGITSWTDQSGAGSSISHDATNQRLNVISNGTTDGHAEQQVTNASAIEHVLRFDVYGAPGDFIKLRIGTSTTGNELVDDFKAFVGFHTIAFTATAANFYVQFINSVGKTIQIDNVQLIDNAAIELTTPWVEADISSVEGPQSADILYMFHKDYPTYRLERRGHTTWSLIEVPWNDGPYLSMNTTATTFTPSATTGLGITITASSTEGINSGLGFLSTDIGRSIRLSNPASGEDWGWAIITGVTSTTVVTVDVAHDFATTTAKTTWRLGIWSGTTGYPSVGAFFEQRLFVANSDSFPQTFWGSQTADFENFTPDSDPTTAGIFDGTVEDDDALDYTISADDVNAIFWMSAGEDTLAIGTAGGEWVPSSVGSVLTPSDIAVKRQVTTKAADTQPVRVDNVVLFVQRAKRKIKEFGFAFEVDGFQAVDMTRLAEHITKPGIGHMSYAEEPDSEVFSIRDDGVLLNMTYRRNEDVVGWGRNTIGGSFSSGIAEVESVVTIPGANGAGQIQSSEARDEVWVIVKRTINSVTKRYIEFFEKDYETGDPQEDAYYADSIITYDGASTTSISGLGHLEGETVKVLADGAVHSDKTVSSGAITLDSAAEVVQIGLGYTHKMKTLRMEGGNPAGTAVGKTKQVHELTFVLLNSQTLQFGPDENNLFKVDFREVGDPMDAVAPIFTGEFTTEVDEDWGSDPRLVIQNDDPTPFTLLALAPKITVNPVK